MKKISEQIAAAALLLLLTIPAAAKDGIYGSAGLKMIFSEEEDISQQYYKSFAVMGWQNESADLSVSYYRWMSYSITDEVLNSKEIDINQPCAEITIYAGDVLSITGGYSYMSGTSSYISHKAAGEIVLDFERFDISFDSSIKNTEYDFNGTIKESGMISGGEISVDITDTFFCDIRYINEYTDYETYGYTYSKNSGRIGILAVPLNNLFFLSGITWGSDSDNINSAGFDAGFTLKLFKHLKLSTSYMLTADFITSESQTASNGRRGSSTSSSGTSSYTDISHTGNISVSMYF